MPKSKASRKPPNKPSSVDPLIRLNKFIADSGLCSRRKADSLISDGNVTINGKRVFELGIKVNPNEDKVLVNGKTLKGAGKFVYYMINKPKNVMTTMDDPLERPKIGDFFEDEPLRIFPVGRLDWDSEGLLLMTNDGEFSQAVTHPKKEIGKTYMVKLDAQAEEYKLKKLTNGVTIVGGRVAAKYVERVRQGNSSKYDWVKIVITEGKNRQVRRMFEKIGYDVTKLHRVAIGGLTIGKLKRGEHKKLTPKDLDKIFMPMEFDQASVAQRAKKSKKKRK